MGNEKRMLKHLEEEYELYVKEKDELRKVRDKFMEKWNKEYTKVNANLTINQSKQLLLKIKR